jgi:PhnB protein
MFGRSFEVIDLAGACKRPMHLLLQAVMVLIALQRWWRVARDDISEPQEPVMSLNTYLYFDGNCAQAFEFYKSVFGGAFTARTCFSDAPPELNFKECDNDRIMHVSLPVGGSVLMGSDTPSGEGEPPKPGNSFSISYSAKTRQETDDIYAALKAGGGEETMPLQDTFWGSYFGMCKDQFGVSWMVSFAQDHS